jgi:methionine-rich copper-binding protein CopC
MKLLEHTYARIGIWVVVVAAIGVFLWATAPKPLTAPVTTENVNDLGSRAGGPTTTPVATSPSTIDMPSAVRPKTTATKPLGFTEKRTPHFVSANIVNDATITNGAPTIISLTFDAPIIKSNQSYITVSRDQIYSATRASSFLGSDLKTLNVNLNPQVSNGDYYVYYVACFEDVGCKDGRFGYHLILPH